MFNLLFKKSINRVQTQSWKLNTHGMVWYGMV